MISWCYRFFFVIQHSLLHGDNKLWNMKSGMFVEQNETEMISGLLILNKQICSPIRSSQNFQVIDMYSMCSTHSKIYGICGTHNLHFCVNYNLNFSLLHTGPVLCGEIWHI